MKILRQYKLYTCGVFVDLEKAFDTVKHKILTQKLGHYGIRGITDSWFSSYLSNRTQTVNLNGKTSEKLKSIMWHSSRIFGSIL